MDEVGSRIRLRSAHVPTEITEKEKELDITKQKKQMAINNQNFELAAGFRDRQTTIEQELAELNRKWQANECTTRSEVNEADVAEVVSMMSGVPVQRVAASEGSQLKGMADKLKHEIIAQDSAIDKIVKAIQRNRVGLKPANQPIGAFMFLGPTGVGKTYLAKRLAALMFGRDDALIRIDMSEYSESFNTSRLVGAPPGYVGYEEGGQLTERVRRHPYSIVLLDEIEKAHGNVFNMLLQVLDEGRLTDGNGRLVDFRNTIIIMTSNAGTRQLKEFGKGVGFTAGTSLGANLDEKDKEYARSIIQKSLSKQFSPEFLNRLDDIITFDQLDLAAIKRIIDLELHGLHTKMEEMGYKLEISDKAKEFVATKGYDVQFGARPLKRAIQTYIEDGICELLLDETLAPGDTILVDKAENSEKLTIEQKK
ncbi:aTP-dependent Clp protease ATP-binding subunit ClpC [Prevotella sp. CAG:1092]|nr:aTP-dependent Clp protease ATP-binding subunit ClpC [Prevotella sp. CAG:1092]